MLTKPIRMPHPITVAILYEKTDGPDGEDTTKCVRGIREALTGNGHTVTSHAVTEKNTRRILDTPADIIFNLVEDEGWKTYRKIGLGLIRRGRAQFAHDKHTYSFAVDKVAIKRLLWRHTISTPVSRILKSRSRIPVNHFRYPVIVKPAHEHAGIGISQDSVVEDEDALRDQIAALRKEVPGEIIVEEFIRGKEIHVTVVGNGNDLKALPPCEIGFRGHFRDHWRIYTYNAKWNKRSWEYHDAHAHAPAQIGPTLTRRVVSLAKNAYVSLKCTDIARFDIRISEDGIPYVIDVNVNPSLNIYDSEDATILSMRAMGWRYDRFMETLLAIAWKRVKKS